MRLAQIGLGLYLLGVGILSVTNIEVVWLGPILGFTALVTGALFLMGGVPTFAKRKTT